MVDPVFAAKEKVLNRFLLCAIAIERSKQLTKGARPRTERSHHSCVTTALQEIAEERIVPGEPGTAWHLR